jgi:Lantibiotic dehydratase, N terminus
LTADTGRSRRPVLGSDWKLWNDVLLRSAGFAAKGVQVLASRSATAAADAILEARVDGDDGPRAAQQYQSVFAAEVAAAGKRIRQIARSTRFQEAVVWQNRHAWRTAVLPFASATDTAGRNHRSRDREELIASYWQRYCVKNDTVGFFGPMAWANIVPSIDGVLVRTGHAAPPRCEVFFEQWAIDVLARTLAADGTVRSWLRPRRVDYVRVGPDGRLCRAGRRSEAIDAVHAELLQRCDGRTTVLDLCRWARGVGLFRAERAVYDILEEYERNRLIVWTIELPASLRPELSLRRQLEAIGDAQTRQRCIQQLDALERLRTSVEQAAGRPVELDAALGELDAAFTRLTGRHAVRHAGRAYAGRTLLFLDCQRPLIVELGSSFLDAMRPITLLLTACRWLTHRVAAAIHGALVPAYERLRAAATDSRVDLSSFWFESLSVLHAETASQVDAIADDLRRRWMQVLQLPGGSRHVCWRAADLAPAVTELFDAPTAGWSAARYHSFDVIIAARDVAAVSRGEFELVLGEVHVALNGLRHAAAVAQHPRPMDLIRCLDDDFPQRRLMPVLPKEGRPRVTPRLHPALLRERDLHIALLDNTVDRSRYPVVSSADLSVHMMNGRLVATAGDKTFDILDVFSEVLLGLVVDRMRITDQTSYSPRITIDRLVVNREAWWFEPSALSFANCRGEAERFLEARRFWHEEGLPRHAFVKSPLEDKPIYVNFESPVLVNLLARAIRRLCREPVAGAPTGVRITEMLPDLDRVWLASSNSETHTSELRLVAFDLRPCPLPARQQGIVQG